MASDPLGDAGSTAPVGSFPQGASPHGVLDMAGNVSEWCSDWYDKNYYERAPTANPTGPASSPDGYCVQQGGSWYYYFQYNFRCANRNRDNPTHSGFYNIGFRSVVRAGS